MQSADRIKTLFQYGNTKKTNAGTSEYIFYDKSLKKEQCITEKNDCMLG